MAPGRHAARRVRRGVPALLAVSLAGALLLGVVLAGVVLVGVVEGSSGTSVGGTTVRAWVESPDAVEPAPPPVPVDVPLVLSQVQTAAAPAGGSVVVVVLDAEHRLLLAGPDAQRPEYSASLIKLLVVAELLARQEAGALDLGPDDLTLMKRTSTTSDDAAMNALWDRHDGPALVTAAAARLGLTGTAPPAVPGQWGEAVTSAADVAAFLSRVGEVLGAGVATTLIGWLRATTARAADGFDQRFGLLSPTAGAVGPVAAKQGWMCCVDGRRQLHSAGVLADGRVVVLLGNFPDTVLWSVAVAALDAAAAAVVSGTADAPGPPSGP